MNVLAIFLMTVLRVILYSVYVLVTFFAAGNWASERFVDRIVVGRGVADTVYDVTRRIRNALINYPVK